MPHLALKIFVKAKTASENRLIWCILLLLLLLFITNTYYMIEPIQYDCTHKLTWRIVVFVFQFMTSPHSETWLSLIKNRTRIAFFLNTNVTRMRILAAKCHRNMITWWYVYSKDVIAGQEYTGLQKACCSRFSLQTPITSTWNLNLQKQVKSRWLPKNRQERQNA